MRAQVSATELAMQICNRLGIHYSFGEGPSTLMGVPIEEVGDLFPVAKDYKVSIAFELKNPEVSSALYKSSLSRETKPASYWMSQDISCVSDPDDFTSSNPSAA